MGQSQSLGLQDLGKFILINDSTCPVTPANSTGSDQSAPIINQIPPGVEPVVLMTRQLQPDACSLTGTNLISLSNTRASTDGASVFALGRGPCPNCDQPSLFRWSKQKWKRQSYDAMGQRLPNHDGTGMANSSRATAKTAMTLDDDLSHYLKKYHFEYVYVLLADANLTIRQTLGIFRVHGTTLKPIAKCIIPTAQTKYNLQAQSSTTTWLVVALIIIVIIAIGWYLYSQRR
jgi:hypothetical protein